MLDEESSMTIAGKVRKVIAKGVFGDLSHVSEHGMSAASLTLTDRSRSENFLVAQGLKRHDPELLDQLIVLYQHRLLRYLLYLTGNRETAEDLFQETWMRVLMRGAQFNGNSRFDTWLFTIARNLVIDMRRKRTMISLEAMCEAGEDDRPFEIPADEPSPFDRFQTQESSQRVAEALLSLEPLYREVLVLRFQEELSLDEIAQVTRAPLSTVKSRLYRGLAALKPRIAAAEQQMGQPALEAAR
jgi:RNA polymerase sigma-70 factor (ECF subfamily)